MTLLKAYTRDKALNLNINTHTLLKLRLTCWSVNSRLFNVATYKPTLKKQ